MNRGGGNPTTKMFYPQGSYTFKKKKDIKRQLFLTKGLKYCDSKAEFHNVGDGISFFDSSMAEHFIKCITKIPKNTKALYNTLVF
ncbi:MAG: hypothetical protein CM15mP83_9780 [Flavobacteriaceae bacterium]|nr:MAG: hypothetical protein CM15mP83_9780 [Flavobacteriaceae bacterium]